MALVDNCNYCFNIATHELLPCRHKVCQKHYLQLQTSTDNCHVCGEPIQCADNLEKRAKPVDDTQRSAAGDHPFSHIMDNQQGNFPPGAQGNNAGGNNNQTPFYRQMPTAAPRYTPPQLRNGNEIVRPESSMSNISNNTFASQIPYNSNYSYGPSQVTRNMSSYQPYNARAPQRAPQGQQYSGLGHGMAQLGMAQASSNLRVVNNTPTPQVNTQTPLTQASLASLNNNTVAQPIAQPTPVRRDSGAPGSHAAYLAGRIKNGDADNPFDLDYGNPGPSKKHAAPPGPIPFPQMGMMPMSKPPVGATKAIMPKANGMKVPDNTDGNPKAFLGSTKIKIPVWFEGAVQNGIPPTLEQAFENLPFVEACRSAVPSTAGVVKIIDIPYATTRPEVNAFLGQQTQICFQPAGTGFMAVHIVMDRHSGKTMDAYVEVSTPVEAVWVVNQFAKRVQQKRPGKLNNRVVGVELSNQQELMAVIFPRGKNLAWTAGGVPVVDPNTEEVYPGISMTGFKGFLQDEEIVHIAKHAETPQRSPFVQRCMIRPYEYLISTLYKFPWFAHEHVFLKERDALFDVTHANVIALIALLRKIHHNKTDNSMPTPNTLTELAIAIFVCPGFTDAQKAAVAKTLRDSGCGRNSDDRGYALNFGGIDNTAGQRPFEALVKQPGITDAVFDYYGDLIADATTGQKQLSLADLHAMSASGEGKVENKFMDIAIDYSNCKTVADAGRAELRYLEKILGRVLARAGSSSASRTSSLQLP